LYGRPTSAAEGRGPYAVQRFERGVLRLCLERRAAPEAIYRRCHAIAAGEFLRAHGLVPAAALRVPDAVDADEYNIAIAPDYIWMHGHPRRPPLAP
jgi:hypothetical protein